MSRGSIGSTSGSCGVTASINLPSSTPYYHRKHAPCATGSSVAWSASSVSHSEDDRSEKLCSDTIGLYCGAAILSESSSELDDNSEP